MSSPPPPEPPGPRPVSGRLVVGVPVLLAVGIAAYFAFGMPGMDHGATSPETRSMVGMNHSGSSTPGPAESAAKVDPEEFAARISDPSTVLINVHTPYEGEIPGTDLFIAYRTIGSDPRLPAEKETPIALYCRSGRMSAIAGRTLAGRGYTKIVELTGGMRTWAGSGRTVQTVSRSS